MNSCGAPSPARAAAGAPGARWMIRKLMTAMKNMTERISTTRRSPSRLTGSGLAGARARSKHRGTVADGAAPVDPHAIGALRFRDEVRPVARTDHVVARDPEEDAVDRRGELLEALERVGTLHGPEHRTLRDLGHQCFRTVASTQVAARARDDTVPA